MFGRKTLLVVAFATLAVWLAEAAMATHGGSARKSVGWPFGSSLHCVLRVAEATLTFIPDAVGSDSGSVILLSRHKKSSTCNVVSDVGTPGPAKFRLDITASNVRRTCTSIGPKASVARFTQECGAGADTTGSVSEKVPEGRVLRIGGMDVLKQGQCKKVFPEDTTGSQPLDIGVTLVTETSYRNSGNCKGPPADDPIVLRMCYGHLGTPGSAPSCLDEQGKPKKLGKGDLDQLDRLDQLDLVGLACQPDPVKQNCDADRSGVVEATIDGEDFDVRGIDTDSLACGDPSSTPAIKFQFGFFVGTKENEDLRVTCRRCVNGQLVPAGGELVVTGDTKGVKLKEDPKFAVGKFGDTCTVTLTP